MSATVIFPWPTDVHLLEALFRQSKMEMKKADLFFGLYPELDI